MPSYGPPAPWRPDPQSTRTMLDLIMQQGNVRAQAAERSGALWGNALQGIGQTIAGGFTAAAEAGEAKRRDAAFSVAIQSGDPRAIISVLGPRDGPAVITALRATTPEGMKGYQDRMALGRDLSRGVLATPEGMRPQAYAFAREQALRAGAFKPEELPESFDEAMPILSQVANYGAEPPKQQGLMTVAPGATVLDPNTGQPVYSAPPPPADAPRPVVVGRDLVDPQTGRVIHRAPSEPRAQGDGEPLVPVMGDDGQPVLMPRSQAAGRRPASSREQGRPVTSGDAGRIADLRTSLDDVAVLRETLSGNKATGAAARAGAMLPNAITEATGIGSEAKQKQATIDRVKQVIGKALEGGVLRKEDEYKYEKILPTIGDPPEIVQSKLNGLERALAQRANTFLESLSDAGYDTGAYAARPRSGPAPAPPPAAGGPARVSSDADYDRLPSGAMFIDPDGHVRRKP